MKTFFTAAALAAVLTLPAFAEGESTGTEAAGEAHGTFNAAAQEPPTWFSSSYAYESAAPFAMAPAYTRRSARIYGSGTLGYQNSAVVYQSSDHAYAMAPAQTRRNARIQRRVGADNETGFSAESLRSPTGADGGNRK